MSSAKTQTPRWHKMRTKETHAIELKLGKVFDHVEAYRYNRSSIRVRIIDDQFSGKSDIERHQIVNRAIEKLPDETQSDIMLVIPITQEEYRTKSGASRYTLVNLEFDDPSPSSL